MAEFCSRCEPEFNDLDLIEIALELESGHSEQFICEGCGCRGIYKDEEGLLYLIFKEDEEVKLTSVQLEQL